MELNIYSIFDSAAKAYMTPFFMHNNALATRAFSDQVNNTDSQIHAHPEQFVLFYLGTYDDTNGIITTNDTPVPLGRGNEYKEEETKNLEFKKMLDEFSIILKEYKTITEEPKLKGVK